MYRALVLEQEDGGGISAEVRDLDEGRLPEGDTEVRVLYSSLNYKDGLAVTGRGKIVRGAYPFVPGIDLVGEVVRCDTGRFAPGDMVIGTGWGLGENHWGGYAERQRVRAEWLVPLPDGLAPKEAMVIGTAGFTAMLSVMALEAHGATPEAGEVVVTGASGGVGSMAVALLAERGFRAVASTGKASSHAYLTSLGAARIIPREELGQGPKRPLDTGAWAGAVDTVGGATLAAVLGQTGWHGSVAACGLAGSHELNTTVFPFILRGVNLLGIDSNTCPPDVRERAWGRLAAELPKAALAQMEQVIGLGDVPSWAVKIVEGQVYGRVVVDVSG